METKKIYLVWGTTGHFEGLQEWIVCAYPDEQMAKDHMAAAQAESHRIASSGILWLESSTNKYDKGFQMDRMTGTEYTVGTVELREKFEIVE